MSRHLPKPSRWAALVVTALVVVAPVVSAGSAGAEPERSVCSGGPIASGNYRSLTVTGVCYIPDRETVDVRGNLTVAPGATLNGVGFANGQLDLSHFNMASVHVHGNVLVGRGAILGLGCTPAMALDPELSFPLCSRTRSSDVVIDESLIANAPRTMYLDGIVVHDNLVSIGGGPGTGVTHADAAFNFPIKDITVDRNVVVAGWRGGWIGAIRDHVGGNLVYLRNAGNDPDANEVITNVVGRNLVCAWNTPGAQYGDARFVPGAAPNVVGGHAIGQCAALTQPFPAGP